MATPGREGEPGSVVAAARKPVERLGVPAEQALHRPVDVSSASLDPVVNRQAVRVPPARTAC